MKCAILLASFVLFSAAAGAQSVPELPPGKYETKVKSAGGKWERGDIILLDDSHYKLSTGGEAGEYRFSAAAQRIFFTSGPLKSAFTKVSTADGKPCLIFPVEENSGLGLKAEVWAGKQ